ncbi:hypothetical protein PHYPO_G00139080 [Pangasianodon hypophthalmus]|uniref:Putative WW-binding domain-containing protein n=1 Tax=Pangasianodon hypophthalmus TaxID=310915 RepID=A0A5N5KD25_PANHP|nr:hypothetical protein PHYPO_G00139080 [Pangasianodon hypophthalmus]
MRKRRAESSSLHEVPQKKKCRCVCDAEPELEAVHALHAAPRALFTTVIGEHRRKRPRCCEDPEQHGRTGAPGHRLSNATDGVNEETGDVRVSGKFRGASGACMCEMASEGSASGTKPEKRTKVMLPDDEDELCAFNSFQFWRTPLPALDLSLLDSPSTTELKEDRSVKDGTEEMET